MLNNQIKICSCTIYPRKYTITHTLFLFSLFLSPIGEQKQTIRRLKARANEGKWELLLRILPPSSSVQTRKRDSNRLCSFTRKHLATANATIRTKWFTSDQNAVGRGGEIASKHAARYGPAAATSLCLSLCLSLSLSP
jgi:hypothetical protein